VTLAFCKTCAENGKMGDILSIWTFE
jgi:hypothetical protein